MSIQDLKPSSEPGFWDVNLGICSTQCTDSYTWETIISHLDTETINSHWRVSAGRILASYSPQSPTGEASSDFLLPRYSAVQLLPYVEGCSRRIHGWWQKPRVPRASQGGRAEHRSPPQLQTAALLPWLPRGRELERAVHSQCLFSFWKCLGASWDRFSQLCLPWLGRRLAPL